jgi:hypothetical protein
MESIVLALFDVAVESARFESAHSSTILCIHYLPKVVQQVSLSLMQTFDDHSMLFHKIFKWISKMGSKKKQEKMKISIFANEIESIFVDFV